MPAAKSHVMRGQNLGGDQPRHAPSSGFPDAIHAGLLGTLAVSAALG
jgi:hypothetical protein